MLSLTAIFAAASAAFLFALMASFCLRNPMVLSFILSARESSSIYKNVAVSLTTLLSGILLCLSSTVSSLNISFPLKTCHPVYIFTFGYSTILSSDRLFPLYIKPTGDA